MIRTQISLDRTEYDLAKAQAAALGISIAELIRRAVREHAPLPNLSGPGGKLSWPKR